MIDLSVSQRTTETVVGSIEATLALSPDEPKLVLNKIAATAINGMVFYLGNAAVAIWMREQAAILEALSEAENEGLN